MNVKTFILAATCMLLSSFQSATATTIYYDVANISGSTWEYNYIVNNDTLSFDIDEFTIYFTVGDYEKFECTFCTVHMGSFSGRAR